MFADSESGLQTISVMGGSVAGVYQLTAPRFGFSRVEMYFLGLASPAEVTPITFVQSSGTSQITIDQVVAANGPRTPSYGGQQKVFRVPAFVVKRQGETVSDAQLQQLQNLLFRWQSRFWRETGGRARSNTTLDGGCSYTLSASSVKVVSGGSTGSVNVFVEPGCTVTASTSDPWISVNVNGAGAANYVVGTNASATARTGTITIAGQPFTVNQYGKGRREAAGR